MRNYFEEKEREIKNLKRDLENRRVSLEFFKDMKASTIVEISDHGFKVLVQKDAQPNYDLMPEYLSKLAEQYLDLNQRILKIKEKCDLNSVDVYLRNDNFIEITIL